MRDPDQTPATRAEVASLRDDLNVFKGDVDKQNAALWRAIREGAPVAAGAAGSVADHTHVAPGHGADTGDVVTGPATAPAPAVNAEDLAEDWAEPGRPYADRPGRPYADRPGRPYAARGDARILDDRLAADTYVTVADPSAFAVGDVLAISDGVNAVSRRIVGISGQRLDLERPLGVNFAAANTEVGRQGY